LDTVDGANAPIAERRGRLGTRGAARLALAASAGAVLLSACGPKPNPAAVAIGDPARGHRLIVRVGCGACHAIRGIEGAHGLVGPPLDNIASRTMLAGVLPNTPRNLVHWLQAPQSVVPGNAMPDMELNDHDARDIAAYLETLR
jgi:cytochrome c2